jgi:hypothetical protein
MKPFSVTTISPLDIRHLLRATHRRRRILVAGDGDFKAIQSFSSDAQKCTKDSRNRNWVGSEASYRTKPFT